MTSLNVNDKYNENDEIISRCEDDFNLLSSIFTGIVYNTIYEIAITKGENNSNIRLEDLYIASLNQFGEELKKHATFKKIIIQFINATHVHTGYKNINYNSSIYRLFEHFIIKNPEKYDLNDRIKFLTTLFFNTYSKFVKKILEKYTKIILFDRQNVEYHQILQKVYYDIIVTEKQIFYRPAEPQYNDEINMIQIINDYSHLKNKYNKLTSELQKYDSELKRYIDINKQQEDVISSLNSKINQLNITIDTLYIAINKIKEENVGSTKKTKSKKTAKVLDKYVKSEEVDTDTSATEEVEVNSKSNSFKLKKNTSIPNSESQYSEYNIDKEAISIPDASTISHTQSNLIKDNILTEDSDSDSESEGGNMILFSN